VIATRLVEVAVQITLLGHEVISGKQRATLALGFGYRQLEFVHVQVWLTSTILS
jgi:hypothetical protein